MRLLHMNKDVLFIWLCVAYNVRHGMLNYKGEGHFVLGNQAAQKDWTIRMMQFFDYYLKGTKEPRWMKEGIHLRERGIDQKYDLLKK